VKCEKDSRPGSKTTAFQRLGWAGAATLTLLTLTACVPSVEPRDDIEVCAELQAVLDRVDAGWPLANAPLSSKQIDTVGRDFESVSRSAFGDLSVVLDSWTDGFEVVAPFLKDDDETAYNRATSNMDRDIFTLANQQLGRLCNLQ
jgi:hypothetical protein